MFKKLWAKIKSLGRRQPVYFDIETHDTVHDEVLVDYRWSLEQRNRMMEQLMVYTMGLDRVITLNDLQGLADNFIEQEPEVSMSTVKVLKNSLSVLGEDDRFDVEIITCQDKESYFLFILNDQSIEIPLSQASKVSDFIKAKL